MHSLRELQPEITELSTVQTEGSTIFSIVISLETIAFNLLSKEGVWLGHSTLFSARVFLHELSSTFICQQAK